jgi:hypothetical protein
VTGRRRPWTTPRVTSSPLPGDVLRDATPPAPEYPPPTRGLSDDLPETLVATADLRILTRAVGDLNVRVDRLQRCLEADLAQCPVCNPPRDDLDPVVKVLLAAGLAYLCWRGSRKLLDLFAP